MNAPLMRSTELILELAANRSGFLWPTAMKDLVSCKKIHVALVRFAKVAANLERP